MLILYEKVKGRGFGLHCLFKPEDLGNMLWKRSLDTRRYVFESVRSRLSPIEAPILAIPEDPCNSMAMAKRAGSGVRNSVLNAVLTSTIYMTLGKLFNLFYFKLGIITSIL